jgi:hypothetical protein
MFTQSVPFSWLTPIAWLDAAVLWFFAWPHWLEYLLIGWVVYGIFLRQQKVNARNYKGVFVTTLTLWPVGLVLQVFEWLHLFALWTFRDEQGPLSALIVTFRAAFSRYTAKVRDNFPTP